MHSWSYGHSWITCLLITVWGRSCTVAISYQRNRDGYLDVLLTGSPAVRSTDFGVGSVIYAPTSSSREAEDDGVNMMSKGRGRVESQASKRFGVQS